MKTLVKYLDLMPQVGSLITGHYIQWVQCLDSNGNLKKRQQELKCVEHMVFHSTQEATAAPSCPNSWQTFQLYSYIQRIFCLWVGGGVFLGTVGWRCFGFFLCEVPLRNKFPTWCQQGDSKFFRFGLYNKHYWVRVWKQSYNAGFTFVEK